MTAISDFATQQNAFFTRQDKAIADLQTDVAFIVKEIATLQNSPGTISAADQASLDAIQARTSKISDELDALDALVPPPVTPTSGAPSVTSLSPSTGPIAGGTPVTITGVGFTESTAVAFGGIAATGISVVSDTQINLNSPSMSTAGVVDVVVTTPSGASPVVAADEFTYV